MENLFIPNIPFVTDIFVGNTAFRQAIVDNNLEVVKDMLDKEIVKVEDKYMMHMRAIHYACQVDTFNILQLLMHVIMINMYISVVCLVRTENNSRGAFEKRCRRQCKRFLHWLHSSSLGC